MTLGLFIKAFLKKRIVIVVLIILFIIISYPINYLIVNSAINIVSSELAISLTRFDEIVLFMGKNESLLSNYVINYLRSNGIIALPGFYQYEASLLINGHLINNSIPYYYVICTDSLNPTDIDQVLNISSVLVSGGKLMYGAYVANNLKIPIDSIAYVFTVNMSRVAVPVVGYIYFTPATPMIVILPLNYCKYSLVYFITSNNPHALPHVSLPGFMTDILIMNSDLEYIYSNIIAYYKEAMFDFSPTAYFSFLFLVILVLSYLLIYSSRDIIVASVFQGINPWIVISGIVLVISVIMYSFTIISFVLEYYLLTSIPYTWVYTAPLIDVLRYVLYALLIITALPILMLMWFPIVFRRINFTNILLMK